MASAMSSALSHSAAPASASPGAVTSANLNAGFRSPASIMASLPRFLVKMATFGYLDSGSADAPIVNASAIPSAEAITTNATAMASAGFTQGVGGGGSSVGETTAAGARESLRGVGNVFLYVTSKWAVLCVFMTILLNRTMIYASLRRPIQIPFKIRLLMRIVPICLFANQVFHILFAMRCQSSSVFRGERADGEHDSPNIDYLFHAIGNAGSWWLDDRATCEAIGMIPDSEWIDLASTVQDVEHPEIDIAAPKGSLQLLWPLYKTLSLSQFVETFSCALIGRIPAAETGMTLLEHSLAFAEAEALATKKTYRLETVPASDAEDQEVKILRVEGEKIVPSEVLYIALISALSHMTSHIMAVFNRQSRYRLLSTGFFGIAFLGGFALALFHGGSMGILEFPTVSVVGFIPHLLIFSAIGICAFIYALALCIASLFPPSGRPGFQEGYANLRANLTMPSVSMSEDFYTTLLKLGFMCLTAASEATYLNEGRAVRVPATTWFEAERSRLRNSQRKLLGTPLAGVYTPAAAGGSGPYAKERKDLRGIVSKSKQVSVGSGKWLGAGEIIRGVAFTVGAGLFRVFQKQPPIPAVPLLPPAEADDEDTDYAKFLTGEPLHELDTSADFIPSPSRSPTESLASNTNSDNDSDSDEDGSPTLSEVFETPSRLAALLDPQTPEDRASARILARHLVAPHVLTRRGFSSGGSEAGVLENILINRRRPPTAQDDEEDNGGPVCVVCQSAPRTIIVWPCRCLCLCEDCRVCLAMNNFTNCVTCRQKSEGFSRIYIP